MLQKIFEPISSRLNFTSSESRQRRDFFLVFEDWSDAINKKLEFEFSHYWNKEKNKFYIEESMYTLDTKTINKNFRDPIKDFVLRGGKRIRPILFFAVLDNLKKNPLDFLEIAIALELAHNGTLVLDDIEDGAEKRRGKPTTHIKYGLDTAVNMGAGLHIVPIRYLLHNNLSNKIQNRLMKIYSDELINVTFGQTLDIYWHKEGVDEVRVSKYLEMVRLKTGSLMRMSTRLACAVANTDEKTEKVFSEYAENLGMAFQIIDDCLDLDPPDERFGKAFGNDITEGKISLPVTYTLKNANEDDRNRLVEILFMHTKNQKYIMEAISIIKKYKSISKSRKFARKILTNALIDLKKKYKKNDLQRIEELSHFIVERKF